METKPTKTQTGEKEMKTCLNCGEKIENPDVHECPVCGSEDLEETNYNSRG